MMQICRTALGIVWAMWFGGLMAVFLFATSFFAGLPRETAIAATGIMFPVFERYHLMLAAGALVTAGGWWVLGKSRPAAWVFAILSLATLLVALSAGVVTPRIMQMRRMGLTQSPEFKKTHGTSGMLYVTEAALVLGAGIVMLVAERKKPT